MIDLFTYLKSKFTAGTVKRYLFSIELYQSTVGNENARTARYFDITEYINVLRNKGYKPPYVKTELYGLKNYYQWLVHTRQRLDNPTKNLYLNDLHSRDVQFQNLFTPSELESLLQREERYELLKWRNQIAISLYIYQGLSTGEIINLTTDAIDFDRGSVFIRATNRSNSRILALRDKQMIFIERYLTFDRPFLIKMNTDKLLIGKLGKPEAGEGIQYLIEVNKLIFPGRNLNPKTIRQSVIVNLFKTGMDIKDVQLFAGHKYPSTTERYRPTDLNALNEAVMRFHPLGEIN